MEDSGIETDGIKNPSGFPFGNTSISDDTGCRYLGSEIHLCRDWRDPHTWRIVATAPKGAMPHTFLLDKPDGEPLGFESRADALAHAMSEFTTIGVLPLGTIFRHKGKRYLTIKVPNMKAATNFIAALDLESYSVSEMHRDIRPEHVLTADQRKAMKDGDRCVRSSSVA